MKKNTLALLILLTLFTIVFTGCTNKQEAKTDALDKIMRRGKLVVGTKFDTKPFGFINEKKEISGFDVDLAKQIAKSLLGDENKVEFKQVTPSSRILSLNSGQVDMVIATMSITKQRNQIIDFSVPYYIAGQALMVPKYSDINSMTDLNGKKVIIIFGSTSEKNVRKIAPEAQIVGYKTYTSGFNALKEDRADALTSDDTILSGLAQENPEFKILPKRYSKESYAVAFRKGTYSKRLRDKTDLIIKDLSNSGKLRQMKSKWLGN